MSNLNRLRVSGAHIAKLVPGKEEEAGRKERKDSGEGMHQVGSFEEIRIPTQTSVFYA